MPNHAVSRGPAVRKSNKTEGAVIDAIYASSLDVTVLIMRTG